MSGGRWGINGYLLSDGDFRSFFPLFHPVHDHITSANEHIQGKIQVQGDISGDAYLAAFAFSFRFSFIDR